MDNQRQECIVYTRVVWWITPVRNFNLWKQEEFKDRNLYSIDNK